MTKKRKFFDQLMEGVEAMQDQREGKLTLRTRDVAESGNEARFCALATKGNAEHGLALLDKLDQHLDAK